MYANRQEAGQKLAKALEHYKGQDVVVLALPRGGIVLGSEIAQALQAPLDVVLVRKISHPISPEYAIGAVVRGERPLINEDEAADEAWLKRTVQDEQLVNENRYELYYGDEFEPVSLMDKTVIVVDDGIATGFTMEAAMRAVQKKQAKHIVVAVPVAPVDSIATLQGLADEVVVLDSPDDFLGSVGAHYQDFPQVDDDEVRSLLREHRQEEDRS